MGINRTAVQEGVHELASGIKLRTEPKRLTRPDANGFHVLPRRWVVERTFAWLMFQRRLARDYELLEATTENLVYSAMIRLMLKRLAC